MYQWGLTLGWPRKQCHMHTVLWLAAEILKNTQSARYSAAVNLLFDRLHEFTHTCTLCCGAYRCLPGHGDHHQMHLSRSSLSAEHIHKQCITYKVSIRMTVTSCRTAPGAANKGPKSQAMAQKDHDTQPRQRAKPQSQPSSPPLPTLSSSIHPAIQAKLQQAHNKLLGPSSQPSRQHEAGPSSSKTGAKAYQKGKAGAKPQPAQGDAQFKP